jgi:hypothetical protein
MFCVLGYLLMLFILEKKKNQKREGKSVKRLNLVSENKRILQRIEKRKSSS